MASWLTRIANALDEPDQTGMSPADRISGSLAGLASAAGNHNALQSYQVQQGAKQEAQNFQLRKLLAQNQQTLASQNAAREQALTDAQVRHYNASTDALTNPQVKPKEENWSIDPSQVGPNGEAVLIEKNSGQTKYGSLLPGQKPSLPKNPNAQPLGDDERAQLNGLLTHRFQVLHPNQPIPADYQLQPGATAEHYSRIASSLAGEENATAQQSQRTFQQNQAQQNRQDRLDKLDAATADEKKRADLAKNAMENLSNLEDIVNRRPELFGTVGGRISQLRQWAGTDDPDIGALKNLSDNLGMVSQSAHGMRSAQHVEQAANSILNSYKNGPDAVKGAIATARKSVSTFLADVGETPDSHPRAAKPKGGSAANNDPLGIR